MTSSDTRTVAARSILEDCGGGAVAVSKPIRAGFTTSAVLAAWERGKRLLCIAPTTRILKETIGTASGGTAIRVPGNCECPLLAEEIEAFPILAGLPLSLPDCSKCPGYDGCPITEILRRPDFETAALTYAKVQALMLAPSETAKRIKAILGKADYVLLDEAHTLGFGSVPSVPVGPLPEVPEGFKVLSKVRALWLELLARHAEVIAELQEKATNGATWQHLSRHAVIPEPLTWKALSGAWSELRGLAKSGQMERAELLRLRDAIEVLSFPWATIHFVSEDEGRGGHIQISGSHGKGARAITEFLHNVVPYTGHVYVSGTLIEPHEGYFAELSGKPVRSVVFPDIKRASERVTLIPDCWSLNAGGFSRKLPAIIDQIHRITEREREPIYCLCQSVAKAGVLRSKLREAGVSGVLVDYYRSDMSIGVARSERICIAVGLAEIPANALDPLARGRDEGERWLDSRRLREQAVHAATWQSINRVRDPEGVAPSRVYLIGVRVAEVRKLARWGPGRQAVPGEIRDGKTADGKPWRSVNFSIRVEREIEHCNIFGEDLKGTHSEKRSIAEMLEKIELYDEDRINSENHSLLPIILYREKGVILGIYNFPMIESEINTTASALYRMFCHRGEVYAQQFKDPSGRWGFSKVLDYIRRETVIDHITGKKTIGVYEIGLDDDVIWGAFDVDSHGEGETGEDARAKVRSICDVLEVYGVPYMLEASGSPGSYHIWIFFKRTRTYNAYRFMRQVASEAKVKGIEIWPKQKKLDKNGKFGNLVKLPICLHNKTGARSAFLDAETFEPLEGLILVPGRVVLLEIPEPSGDGQAMPKARRVTAEESGAFCGSGSLDYCMVRALAEGIPLEGGEGHNLRVAIATKGAFIGMTPSEVGALFSGQSDYDPEFSRSKAEEIGERGYSPWSCDKLRDSCGEFVTRWCPTCPFVSPRLRGVV